MIQYASILTWLQVWYRVYCINKIEINLGSVHYRTFFLHDIMEEYIGGFDLS